jgi:histidine triad (HIT) family protein
MTDTIFTKIVMGELSSYKVYEDDATLAFLNIHPVQPGHTLVIPKAEVAFLWDLDDELYIKVMSTAKKAADRLKQVLEVPYIGMKVEGLDVPHAHIHLIPFTSVNQLHALPDMLNQPPANELKELANKLFFR